MNPFESLAAKTDELKEVSGIAEMVGSLKVRESPGPDARYRTLVEQIPAIVFVAEIEGGLGEAYISPQIEEILGYTQKEWLSNPVLWFQQLHPEDKTRWSVEAAGLFSSATPLRSAYRVLARDGTVVWFRCEVKMVRHPDGRPWFIHGVAFDITEMKRAEEELQREKERVAEARGAERFRRSFEEAPVGMVLLQHDGTWERANRALCAMAGYSESELIQIQFGVAHPAEPRGAEGLRELVLSANIPPAGIATRLLHRNGSPVHVLLSVAVVERDNEGNPVHLLAHFQDITERARVEQDLEASRSRAATSARLSSLGIMAGGIAHEINNPMAIIDASAANLLRMAESGEVNWAAVVKNCERIRHTAVRISKIVRSLRHIARDGSGDEFQAATVRVLVEQTLELCAERFRVLSVSLTTALPRDELTVCCREAQICQVLLNLLQNGFDAALSADSPRWVDVSAEREGGWITISVRDSGAGVPPEIRERIMDPFFTTKPVGTGTGLGLSISRTIAAEHGGRLELAADSPQTCFQLILPDAAARNGMEHGT
jgi:PAS domain S-box-containing protein